MSDFDYLRSMEAIKIVKAKYFRSIDTKDWELMKSILADDVVCDLRGSATIPGTSVRAFPGAAEEIIYGADNVLNRYKAGAAHLSSVHLGHMPEIEMTSETSARAIWAMSDLLRFVGGPIAEMNGHGRYHDTYKLIDGEWKISSLQLTRTRLDILSR